MPEPIRTRILANLRAALAGISVSAGFLTDVRAVLDGPVNLDVQPSPFIWLDVRDETYMELANPLLSRTLPVTLALLVECQPGAGDGPLTEIGRLLADVERAVLTDRKRGGVANDTRLLKNRVFAAEPGLPWVELDLEMQIAYRTPRTDSLTAA
jgi:hypothetical protein